MAADGACFEGITPAKECPHYSLRSIADMVTANEVDSEADELEEDHDNSAVPDEDATEMIELYSGQELDSCSALRVTLSNLAKVIVLAGPVGAGKTTLLGAIFDKFCHGSFADYLFTWSETLPPFDERLHLSRISSNLTEETTERTKSSSIDSMLHLRVRHKSLASPPVDLLFADLSGELFEASRRSREDAERLTVLKRTDHLGILLDARRLISLRTRNQTIASAKMMIRSFLEAGMIGQRTLVEILFTMDDLILNDPNAKEMPDLIDSIENGIMELYKDRVGGLSFRRIAARPKEGTESYGLGDLFAGWVRNSMFLDGNSSRVEAPLITSTREFDLFGSRFSTL